MDVCNVKRQLSVYLEQDNLSASINIYKRCFAKFINRKNFLDIEKFVLEKNKNIYNTLPRYSRLIRYVRKTRGFLLYIIYFFIPIFFKKTLKKKRWTIQSDPKTHNEIKKRRFMKIFGLSRFNSQMIAVKKLKNSYRNERCFIVCTGPSLKINDLDKLKREFTFGVNSITDAYPLTNWRPTFYVVMDYYAFSKKINEQEVSGNIYAKKIAFFNKNFSPKTRNPNDMFLLVSCANHIPIRKSLNKIKASSDISVCVYDCFTVTNMAIQIAIYLGFKEIYLIGVDCNYSTSKIHFIEQPTDQRDINSSWIDDAVADSIDGYKYIKKFAEKRGVKIFNATRGGKLEVFDRVNLDTLIK